MVFFFLISLISVSFYSAQSLAEEGVTSKSVLLGQSTDLTGPTHSRTQGFLRGHKIYFDKVNATGGIYGRKIKLLTLDDAYQPEKTFENTKRLLEKDHAFALFKYYGTATIKAVLPLVEKAGIPMFAPASGGDFFRNPPKPNIFFVRGGYFEECTDEVKLAMDTLKLERFAVFYQDDSYGNDGRNGLTKALMERGKALIADGSYPREHEIEVEAAYQRIKKAKPQAVFFWALTQPALEFLKRAKQDGFSPAVICATPLANPEFLTKASLLSDKVYLILKTPVVRDESLAITREYIDEAHAAGIVADDGGLEGYIDATIFCEALRRTGKNLTRARLKNTFETKMAKLDLKGLKIHFTPEKHQALFMSLPTHLSNGQLDPVRVKD